jgi:hypothetical protein
MSKSINEKKSQQSKYSISSYILNLLKGKQKKILIIAILLIVMSAVAVGGWGRLGTIIINRTLSTSISQPQPSVSTQTTNRGLKEYVYVGGKLVAIEAGTGDGGTHGGGVPAPSGVVAQAVSNSQVNISWTAASGTVAGYQVERTQSKGGPYTVLQANVTSTTYSDSNVSSGTTYMYRVRAVDDKGSVSAYSNSDLATTISFTDDPIVAKQTIVKAQHLTELREAVNAVRVFAGLTAATWTDASARGLAIKAIHITELRTQLDQALRSIGITSGSYTDPGLATGYEIKKVHFEELRQRAK